MSFLAQLVERVTSNDEVSRSSRLEGISESGIDNVFPSPKHYWRQSALQNSVVPFLPQMPLTELYWSRDSQRFPPLSF